MSLYYFQMLKLLHLSFYYNIYKLYMDFLYAECMKYELCLPIQNTCVGVQGI